MRNEESQNDLMKRELDAICVNESEQEESFFSNFKYLFVGIIFGITFIKAEIISWYRIQEMFRLQSFHMYGIIGSALLVGMISVYIIKKFRLHTISDEPITISKKIFNKGQIYGGLIFGLGWGLSGACPGSLFALIGNGYSVILVTLISAIAGTWFYGLIREKLPH